MTPIAAALLVVFSTLPSATSARPLPSACTTEITQADDTPEQPQPLVPVGVWIALPGAVLAVFTIRWIRKKRRP